MGKLSEEILREVLKKSVKGDPKAQQYLYQTYYGMLLSICLRYSKDEDEAKDVLQESFIKIFEKLKDYTFNGSFDAWVKRITVNKSIDNFRKKKRELSIFENEGMIDALNETKENYTDDNQYQEEEVTKYKDLEMKDVLEAVQYLSPAYRTIFSLYVVDGYSHQQIADELNINIGTSKSNYAKAKMNLKKILEKKLAIKNGK